MDTLSNELRSVIGRHVAAARPQQILAIAAALTADDGSDTASTIMAHDGGAPARFEIINNDIVLDHSTGLTWARDYVPGGKRPWKESMEAASNLDLRGWKWRAPTIAEQLSIVDYERHSPAFNTEIFRGDDSWVWTSTPYAPSPGDFAWLVLFNYGNSDWVNHDVSGLVRALRVGQF